MEFSLPGKQGGSRISSVHGVLMKSERPCDFGGNDEPNHSASFKETPDAAQNSGIHRGRYAAGLRILLAGVIHAVQTWRARRNFRLRAVHEFVQSARSDQSALL